MTSNIDVEAAQVDVPGYPSLASFIASDQDRTTVIFKRFDSLAARNLLYLQSELAELQLELRTLEAADEESKAPQKLQAARNWNALQQRPELLDCVKRLRETMRAYREALCYEATLSAIPPPSKEVWKAFSKVFSEPFPLLGGASETLYDDREDLIALRSHAGQDRLSTFAQDHLGCLFSNQRPGAAPRNIKYASGKSIATLVAWISTLIAAVLLIGAIVLLYTVENPKWRLGLIAFFTALFAASVGLLTNARRAELFGSTAAYAAVLVVFVSGNLGSDSGGSTAVT